MLLYIIIIFLAKTLTLPRQKIYFCKFEEALFIKCDVVCGTGLTVRPYSTDGCGSLISTYHVTRRNSVERIPHVEFAASK